MVRGTQKCEPQKALSALFAEPATASLNPNLPVAQIMTHNVIVFETHTSIPQATATLLEHTITGAPVVDATGRPIGMVSQTDLLEAWQQAHQQKTTPTQSETVGDIMLPYLLAVSHHAPISLAAALMAYEGVHRLIVLDEKNQMVGIVTSLDILRWLAQSHPTQTHLPTPQVSLGV